ncbi:hypothetical protein CHS0354_025553 [Potamilus streckersoni]|uniref:UBZ2-type domain-containing protein n=1 Tax=Potamilus streckersoni TaxID=2493646 RepID=A0AAE0S148_9BIVA|nr:hypothetical protein CHS0354_025553 [Potamilus streckersoni]
MQRTGKLKLKRKASSKSLNVEKDYETNEERCFSERIKDNPEDYTNCVSLLSSSDEDQPAVYKYSKNNKTGAPSSENLQHCGKEVQNQGFLDVADVGVREIRQLVLQSRARYIPRPLVDLPPFPGQQELETGENAFHKHPEEVLPLKANSEETLNELAPLPNMCDWCRRRKPLKYDLFEEESHIIGNVLLTGVTTVGKSTVCTAEQPFVQGLDSTNFSHEKLLQTKITGLFLKCRSFNDDLPGNSVNDPVLMNIMETHDSDFSNNSFDLMEVEEGGEKPSESRTTINQGEGISAVSEMFTERRGITTTSSICKGIDNSSALIDIEAGEKPLESTGNKNATLQCCPLCQEKFDPSMCQVAIDGHLAVCLAASTDDVIW